MSRVPYRDIPALLEDNKDFRGNSMRGERHGDFYEVYSYYTLIYKERMGLCVFWRADKYSQTTSHHQSIIRYVKGRKISTLQNFCTRVDGLTYQL